MPFWKQSDDPWDRKPEKRRPMPKEAEKPKKSILERLDGWQEDRKAAAREKEEARRLPPEPCPWCGKDMEQGYLITGRDPIHWRPGIYKFTLFSGDTMRIDTQGDFTMYRTAWLCRECGKMVLDIPEEERVCDFPKDQDDKPSEMTQKEETGEE